MISLLLAGTIVAAGAVLGYRAPRLGIAGTLATLPFYQFRMHLGPLPTTVLELFFLAIFGGTLLRPDGIPAYLSAFRRVPRQMLVAVAVLFTAAVIAIFSNPNHLAALGIFRAYYLEPGLFGLMLLSWTTLSDTRLYMTALSLPAAMIAVTAIGQRFGIISIPETWQLQHRATGIFPYPNAVGLFLAPLVAMWVAASKTLSLSRRAMIANLLLAGVSLIAIVFAQTESALLALLVTAFLFAFTHTRTQKPALIAVASGLIVLAAIPAIAEPVMEKLFLRDFSGAVRRTMWAETANYLRDHWVFGAGLSGYPTAIAPYHQDTRIEIFQYPHTILLNFWVELGVLGVVALFLMTAAIVALSKNGGTALASAPLLVMLVHGLFDVPFFKNDLAFLTAFFIALLILSRHPRVTKERA